MQTSLDTHPAPACQAAPARIRQVILEELNTRLRETGPARARRYRVLKVILFGSFRKGTWFGESQPPRASGINILVLVSHNALAGMSGFWEEIEERLFHDPQVKQRVSLFVHTLPDVNRQLKAGQSFFSEILDQGVTIYEDTRPARDGLPEHQFAKPTTYDPQGAYELAAACFRDWKSASEQALYLARASMGQGEDWNSRSAFQLHQAAESAYRMFLLTVTAYAPATHDLGKLRALARSIDSRLEEAWGPAQGPWRRWFDLLRRAYLEARYSPAYQTNPDILAWQAARIEKLIGIADTLCCERLRRLSGDAGHLHAGANPALRD